MNENTKTVVLRLYHDQRIRFLFVGGINTAVGYGTYALLVFCGILYFYANIISTIIGVTCSYFLNKYFTFQKRKKSYSEMVRFITVYLVSFLLGNILLYLFIGIMKLSPYFVGLINLLFTSLISWFGHKYYSFRM